MNVTIVIAAIVICCAVIFLYKWNQRPVYWSVEDVEKLLQSWLDGALDYNSWDYFEACKIKNPKLEEIRQECLEIYMQGSKYLVTEEAISGKLNQAGVDKVTSLKELCSSIKGA